MKNVTELEKFQATSIAGWDYDLGELKKIEPKDEHARKPLEVFISRNGAAVDVHRTNGRRVFNPFTAMKRTHRRFVSYQGLPLIEIDAANSHPMIMVTMMVKEGFEVEQTLIDAVQQGTFYNYLANPGEPRSVVKERWFTFCYAKELNTGHPVYVRLRELFPKFVESFTAYARGKNLSEYLQELESRIWIDMISKALKRADIHHATIHDSVVFAGMEHVNLVLDIIYAAFGEVTPALHIEWLTGETVNFIREADPENDKYLSEDYALLAILLAAEIDETTELVPDEPILVINGATAYSRNNISTIVGKPKAGKGAFLSILLDGMLNGGPYNEVYSTLGAEYKRCIILDTEQSKWDAQTSLRRIELLGGVDGRIKLYPLRAYDAPTLRNSLRVLIERNYKTTPLFIVDGIRELAELGVNDQSESISIYRDLLGLSEKYGVHIVMFIHENKADKNATGFLGGDLIKKGEISFNIEKDDKTRVYTVKPSYERHAPIDDMYFRVEYSGEGHDAVASTVTREETGKDVTDARQMSDVINFNAMEAVFSTDSVHSKTDMVEKIGYHMGVTRNVARTAVEYWLEKGWITETRGGRNSKLYERVPVEADLFNTEAN